MSSQNRVCIIGFGFLMGYIYPCYENFVGKNLLREKVIAVTADEKSIEDKRKQYDFDIILNDNVKALYQNEPSIILFAPPPFIAPALIEDVLKVYFNDLRKKGKSIPDIYAFPPSPTGDYYLQELGEDVFVCNILPNMIKQPKEAKGQFVEGYTYVTYPNNLQRNEAKMKRVTDFFKPIGGVVEIEADVIMSALAALVMVDVWPYRLLSIAKHLKNVSHKQLAKNYQDNEELLLYIKTINKAISDYLVSVGLADDKAYKVVVERTKSVLRVAKETESDVILDLLDKHATKGGVLEKGKDLYNVLAKAHTMEFFSHIEQDKKLQILYDLSYESIQIVTKHGYRLANKSHDIKFTPEHHASLFALLTRALLNTDIDHKEKMIQDTVIQYALERGGRMAKRALRDKKELTMETYMAYGEWVADKGSMEIKTVKEKPTAITRVYKCPWFTTWSKLGFSKEAYFYCNDIDHYLVKGFNQELTLGINGVKPKGSEYCEFVWKDADLQNVKERNMNDVKDWEYHTLHLLSCFKKTLDKHEEVLKKAYDDFYILYNIDLREYVKKCEDIDFNQI